MSKNIGGEREREGGELRDWLVACCRDCEDCQDFDV